MSVSPRAAVCALALGCGLCACAVSSPERQRAWAPDVSILSPRQMLDAVDAAGGRDDREVLVQPLRDPQVEDLREQAQQAMGTGDDAAAAKLLNQALLIGEPEPGILQQRAEVALFQRDFDRAETLSRRALDLGSEVGPLCRRHWATIEQARLARGLKDDAASARVQIDACTVAGFDRM